MTLLTSKFSTKGLSPLSYFLGIIVTRDASGMFLSQSTYANDIIPRVNMTSCNRSITLVDTKKKSNTSSNTPYEDPTMYRSLSSTL